MHSAKIFTSLIVLSALLLGIPGSFAQVNKHRWLQTQQWSGHGNTETEIFRLYGQRSRLSFSPKGKGAFSVVFVDMQHNSQQVLVNQQEGFAISGRVKLDGSTRAGYLIIRGTGNSWTLDIEQRLDPIDEWNYLQDKQKPIKTSKLGTWSGESGQSDIQLNIPEGHCRLRFEQFEAGALSITVTNQAGTQVVNTSTSIGGEHSAWIHGAGNFVISVHAVQTPWVINAEKLILE
jgi:hypothetical protein